MGKVRKILYICFNVFIIGWTILWFFMALSGVFVSKTFADCFPLAIFALIVWILGLSILLLIRRIIRGKNNFSGLKIRKRFIAIGILLILYFVGSVALLIKSPSGYRRHFYFIFLMGGILIVNILFKKVLINPIDKVMTDSKLNRLRPKNLLGNIFVLIFFFIFIPLTYYGSDQIRKILMPLFIIILALFIFLGKRMFEFNCPYCSSLLNVNTSRKLPDSLDCSYCQNKIKIEPYKGKNKYLYAFLGRCFIAVKATE